MRARPHLVTAAMVALAAASPAGVLVVDSLRRPGWDYGQLQEAVDAAAEGDTILVREGGAPYFVVRISGKSLQLVGSAARPTIHGLHFVPGPNAQLGEFTSPTIEVSDLAPHQSVFVQGFDTNYGVRVTDCEGPVWFDDVRVGGIIFCAFGGTEGAEISRSANVTFTRCALRGESNEDPYLYHPTAAGVFARSSSVHLFGCEIIGGWGENSGSGSATGPATPGAAGISLEESTVWLSGCTVVGGEAGVDLLPNPFGGPLPCERRHPPGGAGIHFADAVSTVHRQDSSVVGGISNIAMFCPRVEGEQGAEIDGPGLVVTEAGAAHHLRVNSPVRAGRTATFEARGVPGEVAFLALSDAQAPTPAPPAGILLGSLPFASLSPIGVVGWNGRTDTSVEVPNVPALTGGRVLYAQAGFLDANGSFWLGGGVGLVLLDARERPAQQDWRGQREAH